MKTKNKIPHLILAGFFGATIASQAATIILSGDFTSHGGDTTSIPSSTITAGDYVSSIDSDVTPNTSFLSAGTHHFNNAVLSQRNDQISPGGQYFSFDFTTWSPLVITEVSQDVTNVNGNGGTTNLAKNIGTGSFDIYQGATEIGSWDITYGTFSTATFTTSGAPIVLDANTTYEMRFVNFDGPENAYLAYSSFEVIGVPEPSSAALLGLGGLAFIFRRRK